MIEFTPSQERIVNPFREFLSSYTNDKDKTKVFVIQGPAGSGKTTLVKYILGDMLSQDLDKSITEEDDSFGMFYMPNVAGVAMAHKAKNILKRSIPYVKTFASFFGLRESFDENGVRSFEFDETKLFKAPCKQNFKVVVFDEVSMFDKNMINIILNHVPSSTKIVLLGDAAQHPPIQVDGENRDADSPVFDMFSNVYSLEEVVRQAADNPILNLAMEIRKEIFGDHNIPRILNLLKDDKIVNGKGYSHVRYRDFLEHYRSLDSNYMNSKVIVYRNKTADKFNFALRNFIYNNPDQMFIPGEIIYMNDTFMKEHEEQSAGNNQQVQVDYILYNSDEFRITKVDKGLIQGVDVYKVYIESDIRNDLSEEVYIPMVSKKGVKAYNDVALQRKRKALEEPDKRTKKMLWKYYYSFSTLFGNCSYGYALTGHKAQGSGYKNIYVDVNDILTIGPISDKRKLQALYTAITRATDLVTFLKSD